MKWNTDFGKTYIKLCSGVIIKKKRGKKIIPDAWNRFKNINGQFFTLECLSWLPKNLKDLSLKLLLVSPSKQNGPAELLKKIFSMMTVMITCGDAFSTSYSGHLFLVLQRKL